MSCAVSMCVFTSQTKSTVATNAIQTAKLSDSTPSELHARLNWPAQLFQVRGTLMTKMSWDFANRNRGVRFGGKSHACSDARVFIASRDVDTIKNEKNLVAGFASKSPSKGPSKSIVHPKKESDILDKLKTISLHLLASEQWNAASLRKCNRIYVVNGTNLVHYLALKYLDIEQLKDLLSLGLLNLDDITPYVLACLNSCIQMLESSLIHSLANTLQSAIQFKNEHLSIANMRNQSTYCRERLLGPLQGGRTTHIMVTIGQEALESPSMIPDILASGATVVRINCAHGNVTIWGEIIKRVRKSSQELEKPCRILMDLAGPKLRTEKLKESPYMMKISPKRMATGDLNSPAQVWLSYKGTEPPAHLSPDAIVYLDHEEFLSDLQLDDIISFRDARGKQRTLKISMKLPNFAGVMSECKKTAYVISGTKLCVKKKGKKGKRIIGVVGDFPPEEQYIKVKAGDLLIISQDSSMEQDKMLASTRCVHRITCSSGYLFDSVKPGETISFDDGKIWGVIQGSRASEITVSITHAGLKGRKLRSEKSINIPDSRIRFEGLTTKDIVDLEFVASQADMVGVSFIRDVRDITVLCHELQNLKAQNLGIVLKIETKSGYEKLPLLLLEAMKAPNPLGVMIARGDLAVECGWENLADIQEEILSTCNASHIPVIWATQVLESLVKSGTPTRAEITDVAAGKRASCIMLNKGENIRKAVSTLDAILQNSSSKVKATPSPPLLFQASL